MRRMAKMTTLLAGLQPFWVNTVLGSDLLPVRVRRRLLRSAGVSAHPSVTIYPHVRIEGPPSNVTVGEASFVNSGVRLDASAPIQIGANVHLAFDVLVGTSTHEIGDGTRRGGHRRDQPVTIEDGCWLGARVTVLPGVTIGAGSVVAAGAVVTDDLKPNGLYGGIPARLIRELPG